MVFGTVPFSQQKYSLQNPQFHANITLIYILENNCTSLAADFKHIF
jgi:hypothetical protein